MTDYKNHPQLAMLAQRLQANPQSTVFVALADMLLAHGRVDEAVALCRKGLALQPLLVSGRLVFARALAAQQQIDEACDVLDAIIREYPRNLEALQLLGRMTTGAASAAPAPSTGALVATLPGMPMATPTMAKLYAAQGHTDQARAIYHTLLQRDPANTEWARALEQLASDPS